MSRKRLGGSLPSRSKKAGQYARGDDDEGFSRSHPTRYLNYNHDTTAIKFSTSVINSLGSQLHRLQKDINRKKQKKKSRLLEACEKEYQNSLGQMQNELKTLIGYVSENGEAEDPFRRTQRQGLCSECYCKEEKLLQLYSDVSNLRKSLREEKTAKEDTLSRLSAVTSSKLRDNNPNLADLSDPNRPSKIGEMFSELYDNDWTDAFEELSKQIQDDRQTIRQLNTLLMTAYESCMKLSKPTRLCFDTKKTKIDSEFRQKVIGHIKQNGKHIVQHLKEDIESEIFNKLKIYDRSRNVINYIRKSIEICWLMVIQDPPMHLYNSAIPRFDFSKFNPYQVRGSYTAYVVWPALALCEGGSLMSKGVAEGTDYASRNLTQTGRLEVERGENIHQSANEKNAVGNKQTGRFSEEKAFNNGQMINIKQTGRFRDGNVGNQNQTEFQKSDYKRTGRFRADIDGNWNQATYQPNRMSQTFHPSCKSSGARQGSGCETDI